MKSHKDKQKDQIYTYPLESITKADILLVGGKAAALGEMINAGINVPTGFAISTKAFGLGMTPQLERDILNAFDELGFDRVAVRSSAAFEDSQSESWAGQLETFVNVNRGGLINSIRETWASSKSARAMAYAKENILRKTGRGIGVVVQAMVDSDVSGIMFTANPVTDDRNQCVIEAAWGLGGLLVRGSITPETFIVDKNNGRIVSHGESRQTKMLTYNGGVNREVNVPKVKTKQSILSTEKLEDLLLVSKSIEKHFGSPQDIEWAIADNKLFILQSRPISTLGDHHKPLQNILSLGSIDYWAEELALPLHGISDTNRPSCRDDFMCVYDNNISQLYFINGRRERDAQTGYDYFSGKDSVEDYTKQVRGVLKKFDSLKTFELSRPALMEMSYLADQVYDMSEAVRFEKFEKLDNTESWGRFKDIAKLRLEFRKKFELFYPQANRTIDQIARIRKVNKHDLFFYTYDELQKLIEDGVKINEYALEQRKNGYIYWIKDGKKTLVVGKRFRSLADQLSSQLEVSAAEVIKGKSVNNQGIIKGSVRRVLHNRINIASQVRRFKDGDILVTEMVRPESIMACRKAKAIITNEGGIISHAAILSREMKIPCIIGTKIATKVLRDGDFVEIDTYQGTIRILKRAPAMPPNVVD